jgi:hypothetical protein
MIWLLEIWYKTIAKCGANEVASCLLDFLGKQRKKGCMKVILYS